MTIYIEVKQAFFENYPGVKSDGIYCLLTGKQIGVLLPDEWRSIIDSIKLNDAESIADDLAVRIFASMRPSPKWNKLSLESLDDSRKTDPIETLAYLLNRLLASNDAASNVIELHHDRIKLYQWLQRMDDEPQAKLLYMLIDIDSKMNLLSQASPVSSPDLISPTFSDSWLDIFAEWYADRLAVNLDLERSREQTTRWYRDGNTLAKRAHVGQFFDSKPPSVAAQRKEAKRQESAIMSSMFRQIMAETEAQPSASDSSKPPKPAPRKQSKGFGGFMPKFGGRNDS